MRDDYEWIETIHQTCGGQGCGQCNEGEQLVRVRLEDIA